jgi:transposase-like protein
MELRYQWCDNQFCRDFGQVEAGNIKVYSYTERRYYCASCGHTFSADRGTCFETLRSAHRTVTEVLALLVERNSLRAVERLKHHPHNAILHWVDLAGQHAAAVSATLIRNLHLTQAQVDELWTFVKKNKSTCSQMIHPASATCGFGEPLAFPVGCVSSVISVMSGVKPKRRPFWPILRPELTGVRLCLPATNFPLIWQL